MIFGGLGTLLSGVRAMNTVTRWNNKNETRKKKHMYIYYIIVNVLRHIKGSLNLLTCSTELLTICSTASASAEDVIPKWYIIFYTYTHPKNLNHINAEILLKSHKPAIKITRGNPLGEVVSRFQNPPRMYFTRSTSVFRSLHNTYIV